MTETIAHRLRQAIENRGEGYSIRRFQQEMSERGVKGSSYPTLHGYLAGRREPPLEFLEEAARVLDVRPEWLILGSGKATRVSEQVAPTRESAKRDEIIETIRNADPRFEVLLPATHDLFLDVLAKYILGAEDGGRLADSDSDIDTIIDVAADLLFLITLPMHPGVWGFDFEPGAEKEGHGVVAMLHALSLLMPRRSEGEPLELRSGRLIETLRRTVDKSKPKAARKTKRKRKGGKRAKS